MLLPFEPVSKRVALDEGQHEEEETVGLARVEEGKNVWVLKLRRGPDLAQKALGTDERGPARPKHLYGNATIVTDIVREVDCRHPTSTDLPLDAVPAL